jgi:sugar/nucleoside kinase (ribokinase family)
MGTSKEHDQVVLVIGACGLDRLLTVPAYPTADAKVRTTAYNEIGGGNAANTATAMALLSGASFLRDKNMNIRTKLLTKVGDDYIGKQLIEELKDAGVDLTCPLFRIGEKGTTTGITSIIVSELEQTRTCLHTYGTCGELTLQDVASVNMDEIFEHVVHFHSDSRHTDAALVLAREARKRGIPVSLDVEKDRNTVASMLCSRLRRLSLPTPTK